MTSAEKVYELVKGMPPHQVSQVLDFAEFIKQKASVQTPHPETTKTVKSSSNELELQPLFLLSGYVPRGWKEGVYDYANEPEE